MFENNLETDSATSTTFNSEDSETPKPNLLNKKLESMFDFSEIKLSNPYFQSHEGSNAREEVDNISGAQSAPNSIFSK